MPKQSKTSKPSTKKKGGERRRISYGSLMLRYMPIEMFVIVLVLTFSLHIRWWPLEFVVSYTPLILILLWTYLLVYATVVTWYMFKDGFSAMLERAGRIALFSFVIGGLLGVYALSYSINVARALEIDTKLSFESDKLTVGTFNKLYRSDNFADDAGLIVASRIDVFSLQEIREDEVDYLKRQVNHPYSYITNCDCSANETELGIISRYPITNALTIYEHPNSVIARAEIDSPEHGTFVVYAVHMHVPYEQSSYDLRDDAFELLQQSMDAEVLPTFAVGDFNTTVYAPDMQKFTDTLESAQNVVSRSWPECSWFGLPLGELGCARIDYVFAPASATVHSMEVGSETHSDHRSVTVEVAL